MHVAFLQPVEETDHKEPFYIIFLVTEEAWHESVFYDES